MKKYRILPLLLIVCLLLTAAFPAFAANSTASTAEQSPEPTANAASDGVPQSMVQAQEGSYVLGSDAVKSALDKQLQANCVMLVDEDSGQYYYTRNIDAKAYPASLTKIMTLLLAVEAVERGDVKLSDSVTAYDDCNADMVEGASNADIKVGETMTFEDFLYCAMISSANEACNVVAEYVCGSISAFVERMNTRAQELGCTGTHFCNPCGLHEDDHYTTAHDLYRIAKQAMKDATFRDIVSTVQHRMAKTNLHEERIILTTNQLIFSSFQPWSYANCLGIKTGHTSQAGNCFVGYAEYGDAKLFSVVLGCSSSSKEYPTIASSFTDTKSLCQWGFKNFTSKTLARQGEEVTYTKVKLSTDTNQVILIAKNDLVSLLPKELDVKDLELQSDIPEEVAAPIKAGDTIGSVTYTYDGRDYGTVELVALNDISRSTVLFYADKLSSFFQSIVFKVLLLAAAAFFLLHIFTGLVFGGVRRRRRRRSSRSRYNDSTYRRRHRK